MKALILTSFITLFSLTCSQGQSQLLEGYLVTIANDTLNGYIQDNNNNWRVNSIRFASSQSGELKEYGLESFSSIYLKQYDDYFFVKMLSIDKKPIKVGELESFPARNIVTETILIKLLAKGKIKLFFYGDENNKPHYFLQKENNKIDELAFVKYNSGGKLVEFPFYIQTLKEATSDCDKVRIGSPSYQQNALTRIIETYNSCFADKQYVKQKEKAKFALNFFIGGRFSNFKYEGRDLAIGYGDEKNGAAYANFKPVINPSFGANIDFQSRRPTNPIVSGFQISMSQVGELNGDVTRNLTGSGTKLTRTYKAKFAYLSGIINVKYFPLKKKFSYLYLKGGLGANYLLKYDQSTTIFDITSSTTSKRNFAHFKSLGLNISGGAGLSFKRFFGEILYQRDHMYASDLNATGVIGSVTVLIGYKIF